MAYADSTATAWGKVTVGVGAVNNTDKSKMPTGALTPIGIIKSGSITFEVQDGETKEWKAVGGTLIDTLKTAPTYKVNFHVKNLNKSVLEKVFGVKEEGDKIAVNSLISSGFYALALTPEVSGGEILEFPRVKLEGKIVYSEDAGYGVDMTATALQAEPDKPTFYISRKS